LGVDFTKKKNETFKIFFAVFYFFLRFASFFFVFFKKICGNKKTVPADFSTGTVLFLKFRKI